MDDGQATAVLGALAQETRLQILRFLVGRGSKGASAGEIGAAVGAASSRASFHLSSLSQAGLVSSERKSRCVIYRAELDALGAVLKHLVQDCCRGDGRLVSACAGGQVPPRRTFSFLGD
ncbi:MAG: metalloregulator ArsR/SmtB family transcription factor [Alphaproteobacteria bacterium]|nr:metalloregulator ArsR/SmtB family transcription factor [Alphaproteobacteria bacterium]NNF24394.1 helix-turn-helix transcriptional regulator [Paracoccaceae bacterium]